MELSKKEIVDKIRKFELFDKEGYPYLLAIKEDGRAKIWCKFCRKWHYHSPEAGHRVSHCGSNPATEYSTTYQQKGYCLLPLSWKDLDNLFLYWPMDKLFDTEKDYG